MASYVLQDFRQSEMAEVDDAIGGEHPPTTHRLGQHISVG